jgi:DnaJ-class molecular chaperone
MPEQTVRDCVRCGGDGCTFAVYGQLDTYEVCDLCNGHGFLIDGKAPGPLETVGRVPASQREGGE